MYYSEFKNEKISALGFGTMRLPKTPDGTIDQAELDRMIDYAMANGVNYFDSAYPYMNGMSEVAVGRSLARYPRDSYYLATKYPGHQMLPEYHPDEVFEDQLKKCGVEYFDFYLLHNVYENDLDVYTDPKWNIVPYFLEQKKKGRIRHLGFSSHARPDCLKAFLDVYGSEMEFILMQTNYLDWTLQNAAEKYRMLEEAGIPIWVMEPLRGGRLTRLTEGQKASLETAEPGMSPAEWSFRFLQSQPNIKVVLSGMSSLEQMKDNVRIFEERKPLSESSQKALLTMAEELKNALPCTACRYCTDGCPMELDIPRLIELCNEVRFGTEGSLTVSMALEAIPEDKQPAACIGCGACAAICPQKIDIPSELAALAEKIPSLPSWKKICEERAAIAASMKK